MKNKQKFMKRRKYKYLALFLIFLHLFVFVGRDAALAKELPKANIKNHRVDATFVPNEKLRKDIVAQKSSPSNSPAAEKSVYLAKEITTPPVSLFPAQGAGLNSAVLQSFSADPSTGKATASIPIIVSPGRKGIEPKITISYSSGAGNSMLGVGWALELGSIERSLKNGIPKYDASDIFVFNSGAQASELVNIGGDEYRLKIEGEFLKINFVNGAYWQVKDRSGTIYTFGSNSQHRFESAGKIFKWCLERVEDNFGNYLTIDYLLDGVYLYPYQIKYTGNSVTNLATTNLIEFNYINRADSQINNRSGISFEINKLLSDITVYADSIRQRKYHFNYEANSTDIRALLKSVVQYGKDDALALPAVTFTYQAHASGWESARQALPDEAQLGPFTYLADVNNDGFVDILRHYYVGEGRFIRHTFLGQKDGSWAETRDWYPPESQSFGWQAENARDNGIRLVDVNGDGWVDMVAHLHGDGCGGCCYNTVFINNKSYGWVRDDSWRMPEETVIIHNHHVDVPLEWREYFGVAFVDINSDGRVDILKARSGERFAYLNTGTSWQKSDQWAMPDGDLSDGSTQFGDLNGDGLTDFMILKDNSGRAYLNTGSSWQADARFDSTQGNFSDGSTELIDVNQDGLSDIVIAKDSERKTFLNTGLKASHWQENASFTLPEGSFSNFSTRLSDTRGHATPDILFNPSSEKRLYANRSSCIDYLVGINNGLGGSVNINYKSSVEYDNTGGDWISDLPFPLETVSSVTTSDGRGNAYTTRYEYKDGLFDFTAREFRGFRSVKVIDAEGNYTQTEFEQDAVLKGRIRQQETYDAAGKIYAKTFNHWAQFSPYSGVSFPFIFEVDNYAYDAQGNSRSTRTQTDNLDQYGNPGEIKYLGDVDVNGDEKRQFNEYVYNAANWIVGLPKHVYLLDSSNNKISEKWFYYDNHESIDDPPDKGLLTKEETLLSNPVTSQAETLTRNYTYDGYGNLISSTDALGRTTTTIYDNKIHAFPLGVVNPLGQVVSTVYYGVNDSAEDQIQGLGLFGQVKFVQDVNSQRSYSIYDGLGRLIQAVGPNDSIEYPGTIYEYNLSLAPIKITKRVKVSYDANIPYAVSYQFFDGLGRLIQARSPAKSFEGKLRQVISGEVVYGRRAEVLTKYLPYFTEHISDSYSAESGAYSRLNYDYDCLGRVIRARDYDGNYATMDYSARFTTEIDENGHKVIKYFDAWGRVNKVEEYAGSDGRSSDYPAENYSLYATTNYEYDALGNLIKVTDNQGNITQIWYDSLGRKVKMDDPDMGVWAYTYDKVGNLIYQRDAKGQNIGFSYDALNRLIRKWDSSVFFTQTLANYGYDDPLKNNCLGRLSKITDRSGSTEFFYDNLGREIKSTKIISGSGGGTYNVERGYDPLGRLVSLTYPDGEKINYSYSDSGMIERIYNDSGYEYVKQTDEEANHPGSLGRIKFGNDAETNYTYDRSAKLSNLVTYSSSRACLQQFDYSFDSAGNIKKITDGVGTATQNFQYDSLSRLIGASGAYGNFSYVYDPIGNMTAKEGTQLAYGTGGKLPHAVTQFGANPITYDQNGNMLRKDVTSGGWLDFNYDVENRLNRVNKNGTPQAQIIHLTLKRGWNFVSFSVLPENKSVSSVLNSISGKYDQVLRYNSSARKFEYYVENPRYDQFNTFEYLRGYIIFVKDRSGASLEVSGFAPQNTSLTLYPGFNLIGSSKDSASSVIEGLGSLNAAIDYTLALRYNNSNNKFSPIFENLIDSPRQLEEMQPNTGYFLHCKRQVTYSASREDALTEFSYDGDGGRAKKSTYDVNGALTAQVNYIGSLYEVAYQYISGSNYTKHIYLGPNRICSVSTPYYTLPALGSAQLHYYYYHSDHLGSSNLTTDSSGNIVALTEFTPYGSISKQTGSYNPRHKFTGKELDSTGLYFYGARYYDHELGRFITPDTIVQAPYDPQSLNRYSYCRNNPINLVDPSGYSWKSFWKKFGGAIASVVAGIVVGIATAGIGTAFYTSMMSGSTFWGGVLSATTSGAIAGTAAGSIGGTFYGQNIGQSMLMGAAFGALSGAVFGGMISKVGGSDWNWKIGLERFGLSSVAGGGIAELAGGSFENGAMFAGAFAGADFLYNGVMNTNPQTKGQKATMATADESGQPRLDEPKEALMVNGHSKNSNTVGLAEKSGAKGFVHTVAGETGPVMNFLGKNVFGFQGMSRFHDNITTGFRQLLGGGDVGKTANGLLFNFQSMAPSYAINAMGAVMNNYPAVIGQFSIYGEGSN